MKHKTLKAAIALVLLALTAVLFWIGGIIMNGSASDTLLQGEIVDYVIIPGCALDGRLPGKCLQTRIDTAVEYLRGHSLSMVVCSGGQGNDEEISEAEAISEELQRRGIPKRRIILEDKSTSTYENFLFSKQILDKRKGDTPYRIAAVTNDFHVYRARRIAQTVGFDQPAVLAAQSTAGIFYPGFFREIIIVAVKLI